MIYMVARELIRESVKYHYENFQDNLALTVKFLDLVRKNDGVFVFSSFGSMATSTNPYSPL